MASVWKGIVDGQEAVMICQIWLVDRRLTMAIFDILHLILAPLGNEKIKG